MTLKPFKLLATAFVVTTFAAGTAVAGDKAGCKDKKTAMKTQAGVTIPTPTEVLSVMETGVQKTKKMKKAYSFDEALEICQKKAVDDLQACIDYKTGKTTPKS